MNALLHPPVAPVPTDDGWDWRRDLARLHAALDGLEARFGLRGERRTPLWAASAPDEA